MSDPRGKAYETVIDALAELGHVRSYGDIRATARCPAHDDRNPSLSVTRKRDRALVKCHAGCDTQDVLATLELTMADLFDDRRGWVENRTQRISPEDQARAEVRKSMTPPQRKLDDLLHLPDIGERLCKAIGRIRPELYLMEKRELSIAPNSALLSDPSYRHAAHLLGGVS